MKMIKIEVIGSGCAKCRRLHASVLKAVKKAGIEAEVVKVEDIVEIMERGIMLTPALIINGETVSSGKVLDVKDILDLLK
ncbi:MAG: thioredoxin family protein [Thermoplasmatota archaeon]